MSTFEENLLSSVRRGDVFVVAGAFRPNATKAKIELKTGPKAEDDTVLAVELNLNDSKVILTSHKYGKTCRDPQEHRKTLSTDFQIHFLFSDYKIDIALYDENIPVYESELESLSIKYIVIDEDIEEIHQFDHR
jgi:Galactoside-binding lectin